MRRLPNWSSFAAIAVMLSGIILATIVELSNPNNLQTFGEIPGFSLIERNGQPFTDADLEGQIWIADFIFTNCAGTCPIMTDSMKRLLQNDFPENVRMVSFTVDPYRDTPEVLTQYAQRHSTNSDRWLFVTGEKEELYKLAKEGFHLVVDDTIGTEIEPITHSTRFALIDPNRQIRSYYDGTASESMARIVDDVWILLDEITQHPSTHQ